MWLFFIGCMDQADETSKAEDPNVAVQEEISKSDEEEKSATVQNYFWIASKDSKNRDPIKELVLHFGEDLLPEETEKRLKERLTQDASSVKRIVQTNSTPCELHTHLISV